MHLGRSRDRLTREAMPSHEEILQFAGELSKALGYELQADVPLSRVADPTGAGDGYRAGFWAAKIRGYSDLIACRIGSIVSSFIIKKVGAQTNLPSWSQVVERYKKNFGDL